MHNIVLSSVSGIFKFKSFLDAFRRASFDVIEKESIDVVAGHWLIPAGIVMKSIDQTYGLPMVLSSHGTDVRVMNKYMGVAFRFLKPVCRKLHSWTVVSDYLKQQIVEADNSLAEKIQVLPLPHDETVFFRDPSIRKQEGLVAAVTRFTDQKRVDYLIRAFAEVRAKNSTARLLLCGTGPLEAEIRSLITSLHLDSSVTITPPVPQADLRALYNKATVVVLNSVQEGFGLVISEAMMCGTAVIGATSGGIPGIIQHSETGLLVKPNNVDDLADAIIRILQDSELRSRLAEAGHNRAHALFASGPLSSRYARLIHEAAGKKTTTAL
jgi:glycosyltransferase involved in cell wall biosynthesis